MNKLTIIGNLTADPVTNTTQTGKKVCNFNVAVNRRGQQQEGQPEADFFRVSAWNKLGESCQQYLKKGRKVAVVGSVSMHLYTAQDGSTRGNLDVTAQDVEFLSSSGQGGATVEESSTVQEQAVQPNMTPVAVDDDQLPF